MDNSTYTRLERRLALTARTAGWRIGLLLAGLLAVTTTTLAHSTALAQSDEARVSGLTLASGEPGQLSVSWSAPSDTPDDYRINWAKSSESFPSYRGNVGNAYPATNSYELTGLEQGVEYKVRVRARFRHPGSSSPWSEEARFVVSSAPVTDLTSVRGLVLSSDPRGNLVANWDVPSASPHDYRINWAKSSESFPSYRGNVGNAYPTTNSYELTGLEQGVEYKVRVRARFRHPGSSSPWSEEARLRTNSAAAGAPSISGVAQVGATLTADTSSIVDPDGLTTAVFSYQWSAATTNIAGATSSTYTLTDGDEGKTVKVAVSFTDDRGHLENLTSAGSEVVRPRPNRGATGTPAITGTLQVGATLTADTSGIVDPDGLTAAVFSYQWSADDTNIAGATSSTYTLADDDQGKTVKVAVSFTDDRGHEETLTSSPSEVVEPPLVTVPTVTEALGSYITPIHPTPPASHGSVIASYIMPSIPGVTTGQGADFDIGIGGLVPDADEATRDYVFSIYYVDQDGSEVPGCQADRVGGSIGINQIGLDGTWAYLTVIPLTCPPSAQMVIELLDGNANYLGQWISNPSGEDSSRFVKSVEPVVMQKLAKTLSDTGEQDIPQEGSVSFIPYIAPSYPAVEHPWISVAFVSAHGGAPGRGWGHSYLLNASIYVSRLIPDDNSSTVDYIISVRVVDSNGDEIPACSGDRLGESARLTLVSTEGEWSWSAALSSACDGGTLTLEILNGRGEFISSSAFVL